MAKTTTSKSETPTETQPLAVTLMVPEPTAAPAWTEVLNAHTRFVMDRLKQDIDTQKAILNCRNPADLMQIQSNFFRKAITQYAQQTALVYDLTSEAMAKTLEAAQKNHSRAYDDIPV